VKPKQKSGSPSDDLATMASPPRKKKLCGLFTRKERWALSAKGWFFLLLLITSVAFLFLFRIQPFLAPTERVETEILVVEGWIHEYAIRTAVEEAKKGSYQHVLATGGPVAGSGGYVNDACTSASVGADRLRKSGLAPEIVQMVPSRVSARDRTYSSAIALRDWFREHDMKIRGFNIVTEDAHARRTRLLYQKAFGGEVQIGIIAVRNPDYDVEHWWRYSEGVREILGESLAYFYAKFFFHPAKST
jgi:uncharacterized SAM-binding protein YcdF (DUF218 family)